MQVHVSPGMWGLIFAAATLVIVVFGFPLLLRGGGRGGGRRGRMRRGGYRMRYGPSLPLVLAGALIRRLDAIVLAVTTVAVIALVIWNGRA